MDQDVLSGGNSRFNGAKVKVIPGGYRSKRCHPTCQSPSQIQVRVTPTPQTQVETQASNANIAGSTVRLFTSKAGCA